MSVQTGPGRRHGGPRNAPPRELRPTGLRRTDKARAVVPLTLTGAVPEHPLVDDNLSKVLVWNGRTNQRWGTCGPCCCANSAIQARKYLLASDISMSDAQIFDLYQRSGNPSFDPATGAGDDGVDMTVMLAELVRNGMTVTKADGVETGVIRPLLFARVPFPPYDNLHALTAIFGGAALAVDLDQVQDVQTDAGLWDYVPGSPSWGGHAVWGGAYTSALEVHSLDESLVTWMQRCGTTPGFLNHQLAEVYVIVWPELWDHPGFTEGVDRAALVADFEAITGRAWTGPDPGPPPPVPVPPPAPVPPGLDAATETYLRDPFLMAWARRRHTGARDGNLYAARKFQALYEEEIPL